MLSSAAWRQYCCHSLIWRSFGLGRREYQMDALYYLGQIAHHREETDRAIRFYSEVKRGSYALESQQRAAAFAGLCHRRQPFTVAAVVVASLVAPSSKYNVCDFGNT